MALSTCSTCFIVVTGICTFFFGTFTGTLYIIGMRFQPDTDCWPAAIGWGQIIMVMGYVQPAIAAKAWSEGTRKALLFDLAYTAIIVVMISIHLSIDKQCAEYESDNDDDMYARSIARILVILNALFLVPLILHMLVNLARWVFDCSIPSRSAGHTSGTSVATISSSPSTQVRVEGVVASSRQLQFMGIEMEDGPAVIAVMRQTDLTITGEGEEATIGVRQHTGVVVG